MDAALLAIIIGTGLLVLALLAGLAVRFAYARYAPESFRIVASDLPDVVVWDRVNSFFPEHPEALTRFWTRQRDPTDSTVLSMASFPLSRPGIALLMCLTLVVPALVALLVMGRQEYLTVYVQEHDGGSHVTVKARGYVACVKAEEFLRQVSR